MRVSFYQTEHIEILAGVQRHGLNNQTLILPKTVRLYGFDQTDNTITLLVTYYAGDKNTISQTRIRMVEGYEKESPLFYDASEERQALRRFWHQVSETIKPMWNSDKNRYEVTIMEIDLRDDVMAMVKTGCKHLRMVCPGSYSRGLIVSEDGGPFLNRLPPGFYYPNYRWGVSHPMVECHRDKDIVEVLYKSVRDYLPDEIEMVYWQCWLDWKSSYEEELGMLENPIPL